MALVYCRARRHRRARRAHAALARVRLRAGIAVAARRPVRARGIRALLRDRVAGPGLVARVRRRARVRDAHAGLARVRFATDAVDTEATCTLRRRAARKAIAAAPAGAAAIRIALPGRDLREERAVEEGVADRIAGGGAAVVPAAT